MAVAVLFTTSCAKEDISSSIANGEQVEVTFTANLASIGTRADALYGTGNKITTLRYFVYDQNGNLIPGLNTDNTITSAEPTKYFNVPLVLIKGMTYKIFFWADSGKGYYSVSEDGKTVTANYNGAVANDEERDAFYYVIPEFNPANASGTQSVELRRPFAQLNAITNDFAELAKSDVTLAKSKISGVVPTTLNVFEGSVGNPDTVTFDFAAIPTDEDNEDDLTPLSMNYILAPANQKYIADITFDYEGSIDFPGATYTNIPLQRNYKTNIIGSLLSKSTEFEVTINAEWETEEEEVFGGGVITLTEDTDLEKPLTIHGDAKINLEGHTLRGVIVVLNDVELIVNNGTIVNTDRTKSAITSNGTLILNDVTIESARHAVRIESGDATINGGTYKVNPISASTLYALNVGDGANSVANVTINGGTFIGPKGTVADSGGAVTVKVGSTVTINGGDFSGGKTKTLSSDGTIVLAGGSYDQKPNAEWIANGYRAVKEDGKYIVTNADNIIINNSTDEIVAYVLDPVVVDGEEYNQYGLKTAAGLKWMASEILNPTQSATLTEGDSYEVKDSYIKLLADIDLAEYNANGEPVCFEPIGSYRNDKAFTGVFDGDGHTIKNLNQNTWELDNGYYYTNLGMGLFSCVEDATIKNLTMDNASISGESALCGIVAATAYGDCTFENITIKNSKAADYQYYSGGIVGWASGNHKYINCNIDASTTIAAQWGDFDNSTGGVIGGAGSSAQILMKDCNVACRIDAYNDVTSTYQWYAYRRCGMLIGNTGKTTTNESGSTIAAAPQLTCENVTVTYGEWANYTYCEFAGTSWPYVRVQAGVSNSAYSNPRYGHPTDANGNTVVDDNHVHNEGEDHHILCEFDQLYGGGQGVYGNPTHEGVTVVYNNR